MAQNCDKYKFRRDFIAKRKHHVGLSPPSVQWSTEMNVKSVLVLMMTWHRLIFCWVVAVTSHEIRCVSIEWPPVCSFRKHVLVDKTKKSSKPRIIDPLYEESIGKRLIPQQNGLVMQNVFPWHYVFMIVASLNKECVYPGHVKRVKSIASRFSLPETVITYDFFIVFKEEVYFDWLL